MTASRPPVPPASRRAARSARADGTVGAPGVGDVLPAAGSDVPDVPDWVTTAAGTRRSNFAGSTQIAAETIHEEADFLDVDLEAFVPHDVPPPSRARSTFLTERPATGARTSAPARPPRQTMQGGDADAVGPATPSPAQPSRPAGAESTIAPTGPDASTPGMRSAPSARTRRSSVAAPVDSGAESSPVSRAASSPASAPSDSPHLVGRPTPIPPPAARVGTAVPAAAAVPGSMALGSTGPGSPARGGLPPATSRRLRRQASVAELPRDEAPESEAPVAPAGAAHAAVRNDTAHVGIPQNDAVPGDAVPGDAVPGDAVPGDAVPDGAAQVDAVPGDAVPGDAVPDGAVPESAPPAPESRVTRRSARTSGARATAAAKAGAAATGAAAASATAGIPGRAEDPAANPASDRAAVAASEPRSDLPRPVAADPAPAPATTAQHARTRRAARIRAGFIGLGVAVLVIGTASAVTAAVLAPDLDPASGVLAAATTSTTPVPLPEEVSALPAPSITATPALVDVCADPAFVAAVDGGDDAAAIAAAGGAASFRTAVASGAAPCVPLHDPNHVWAIVNKQNPYDPIDYRPSSLATPANVRDLDGGALRTDAADALTQLVAAAQADGAGELALDSGYRSYQTQRSTYGALVSSKGRAQADLVSARPGYSEHQSGLAADVTSCDGDCAGLDAFAGTPQQAWVAEHAWEYGWIVRYEDGQTAVTGYSPEPWHLRYLGPELAAEYHAGGWHTLEEFFGQPAAPDYVG